MRAVKAKLLRKLARFDWERLEVRKRAVTPFKRFYRWYKRIYNMGEVNL